jgi:uncharacterized protein (DUF4213/DUF364 family)
MSDSNTGMDETLAKLRFLYEKNAFEPGVFIKAGLKQGWDVVIGSRGQCGMAMSFAGRDDVFGHQRLDLLRLQSFIGRDFFSVAAAYLGSGSWHERSIGVASMVALSQPLLTPESLRERGFEIAPEGTDFASCIKPDDVVAVVGFGGGIKRLIGKCREIHVSDLRPRDQFQTMLITEREVGFVPAEVTIHPEEENGEILGRATAVSITGSALVNGTFDQLLRYSQKARLRTVYGASAGIIPDVLFERGIQMVFSSRISNAEAFERGMIYDLNMEAVMQSTQTQQTILPLASRRD